jgi:hypothetical protein
MKNPQPKTLKHDRSKPKNARENNEEGSPKKLVSLTVGV